MATMPNVVGMGVTQATTTLIAAGIVPDNGLVPTGNFQVLGYFDVWPMTLTWLRQPGVAPGVVTAQIPAAGTIGVAFDTQVSLQVSNFPFSVADRYNAGAYDPTPPNFFPSVENDILLEDGTTILLETIGNLLLEA